jgi:hypothetical protein
MKYTKYTEGFQFVATDNGKTTDASWFLCEVVDDKGDIFIAHCENAAHYLLFDKGTKTAFVWANSLGGNQWKSLPGGIFIRSVYDDGFPTKVYDYDQKINYAQDQLANPPKHIIEELTEYRDYLMSCVDGPGSKKVDMLNRAIDAIAKLEDNPEDEVSF